MQYLDGKWVVAINEYVTSVYDQPHFVMSEANLEHVLDGTKRYAENVDYEEERLFKKAAYLLYHLAFDAHAFADGNKRTALSATAAFLNENLYLIDRTGTKDQKILPWSIQEIAEGKKSISSIYKWL